MGSSPLPAPIACQCRQKRSALFSCCLVEAAACILIRRALRRLRMSVVRPAVLHAVTPVLGVVDLERLASALGSFKS